MSGCAWLILPTYDEAADLAAVVPDARAVLARAAPEGFGILVVDDASRDGTGDVADALAALHPEVEVLHRPGKAASARPTRRASSGRWPPERRRCC